MTRTKEEVERAVERHLEERRSAYVKMGRVDEPEGSSQCDAYIDSMSGKFLVGSELVTVSFEWHDDQPAFTVEHGEESWSATAEQIVDSYEPVSGTADIIAEVAGDYDERLK